MRDTMNPGMRLRRARRLNGIKSTQAFSNLIYQDQGIMIGREKLARMERDQASPTTREQIAICKQLSISADSWVMGDATTTRDIQQKLEQLDDQQRKILLAVVSVMTEQN